HVLYVQQVGGSPQLASTHAMLCPLPYRRRQTLPQSDLKRLSSNEGAFPQGAGVTTCCAPSVFLFARFVPVRRPFPKSCSGLTANARRAPSTHYAGEKHDDYTDFRSWVQPPRCPCLHRLGCRAQGRPE